MAWTDVDATESLGAEVDGSQALDVNVLDTAGERVHITSSCHTVLLRQTSCNESSVGQMCAFEGSGAGVFIWVHMYKF